MKMVYQGEDRVYGNVPHASARSEDRKVAAAEAGIKQYRLAVVILGILCVIQAAVIIFLLHSLLSERRESKRTNFDVEAGFNNLTEERDDLKMKLNNLAQGRWEYFSGSFYHISSIEKPWQGSRDDCLEKGADLVIINSKEEEDFIRKFQKVMWIGLTDSETEGTWKWVDGTPLNESYWATNEPNGRETENCGNTFHYAMENSLNDSPCYISHSWVCERKVCPFLSIKTHQTEN
ncbi:CD209 antigen-like protein E isoform X1 [Etheostoma cragini]|uniref:CD209 antigen-like protein E isoform X1 n=1 Tax=Etheostoma cragini TaxID=417921 RepID=UPI00155EB743|nr:CD209 antigen-like protein E isoform X1 [Etheostoma cragini]